MKYYIFLLLALLLAISTYGVSIIVFWLFYKFNQLVEIKIISDALDEAEASNEAVMRPIAIDRNIRAAFKRFGCNEVEFEYYPSSKMKWFAGTVLAPSSKKVLYAQIHVRNGRMNVSASDISKSEAVQRMNDIFSSVKEEMKKAREQKNHIEKD